MTPMPGAPTPPAATAADRASRELAFTMFYGAEAATHYVEEVSDLGALPLTLRTIQTQWAYAVEWRRRQSEPATAMLAAVTIHVLEGAAGVGILEPAGAAFADEEIVSAASHPACVHLVVPCAEDFGALVVRNASPNGASRAIVMDISFVPLDDPHASSFPPMLSSPSPVPGWARYYSAEGLTPVERLRAARFGRLDSASLVRWADGLEFQVHPDDQLSRVVFVSGTYEPNTLAVLRTFVRRGDTFIDVGGNAGIVSLAAASWVGPEGRVHAFEPSTREYTRLLDTVARNRLHQVAAHHVALGARSAIGALHVASPPHAGLNTFGRRFSYGDISAQGTEDVAVRTLDDVAAEGTFGKVAAIKIDVEGMELDVLQGARALLARDHPALVIEVNDRALEACGASVAALEDLLIASGYTLWEISEDARLARLASLRESASENIAALYG